MNSYLIEFAIANTLLFVIYLLFLRNESNFQLRRNYLLFGTVLSLILPLIEIPTPVQVSPVNIVANAPRWLVPIEINTTTASPAIQSINWLHVSYWAITAFVALRFLLGLVRIWGIYQSSVPEEINNTVVHTTKAVSSHFTFFKAIFISLQNPPIKPEIVLHEKAHVKHGHSLDLLLMNLTVVIFWWVPTVWFYLREIKLVHEYQADEFVISRFDPDTYRRTLINHKLNEQGLYLSNYFNDNQLSKRINTMKTQKLKIRPWKLFILGTTTALTFLAFACQEKSISELQENLDSVADTRDVFEITEVMAQFPGGSNELASFMASHIKYPEEAVANNIEGKVMVEFIANTDGSLSNIKVLKGIGFGCDEEAVRVLRQSPKWIPAEQRGIKVRQRLVLPVSFKLPNPGNQETSTERSSSNFPFPGGIDAFSSYVQGNLKYPSLAKENQIEGTVYVEFIIQSDGKVAEAKVLKGIGYGCDEEALRIIGNSPNWNSSSMENQEASNSKMVIPIQFKLT